MIMPDASFVYEQERILLYVSITPLSTSTQDPVRKAVL